MEANSFISSFDWKIRFLQFFVFILIVFTVDFSFYEYFFRDYDKFYKLSDALKKHDVLIIGSSHILWDLDSSYIAQKIGKKVGVLNVPGANMELRYHFLKDYLNRFPQQIPEAIILETDKYVFHPTRYPDDVYKSILGYYHKGICKEYSRQKIMEKEGMIPTLALIVFRTYSLNQSSSHFGEKLYHKIFERILNFSILFISSPLAAEEKIIDKEEQTKIEEWKSLYKYYDNSVEEKYVGYYRKFIELCTENKIKLYLLETPNFNFGSDEKYDSIREIFKKSENENTFYLRLNPEKFENKINILHDASHLNVMGRIEYTNEFLKHFVYPK